MTGEELKDAVVKLLITEHDFESEEAEFGASESLTDDPDLWHENAEPKDLANFIAEGTDD